MYNKPEKVTLIVTMVLGFLTGVAASIIEQNAKKKGYEIGLEEGLDRACVED